MNNNTRTCFICQTDLELLEIGKTESLKDAPLKRKSYDQTISKQTKIVHVFCNYFNLHVKEELKKSICNRRSNFTFCETCKTELDQILNLQSLLDNFWNVIKEKIRKNKLKNIDRFDDGKENGSDAFREQIFKVLAVKPNGRSKRTKPHFKSKGAVKTTNRLHFINEEITKNPYVDLGEKVMLFCEKSITETQKDTIHDDDEIETSSYYIKDEIQEYTISSPNSPEIPFAIHNESDSPSSDFESGQEEADVVTENQTSHSKRKKRNNRNSNLKNRKPQRNTARNKTESLEKVTKTSEGKVFFKNLEIILCDDEKSIQCSLCDFKVNNNRYYNMKIHMLGKHLKAFYCADCDKTFNSQQSLNIHMTAIHRWRTGYPEKYECKICSKPFKYRSNAQTHEITHLGEEEKMAKERKNVKSVDREQKNRKQMRFTCEECGKSFQFDSLLQYHMVTHVDINERGRHHLCPLCGKTFVSQRHLRHHNKFVHNKDTVKGWVCKLCGLKCYNPSSLSIHMRSHTKEKPFLCQYCEKSFSTMGGLKAHTPMHTGERNYKCKQCDKSYTCSKHLLRHVQSVHLKMKIKKYRKPKKAISDDSSTTAALNLDPLNINNGVNQSIPLVMNSHTDLMTFRLIEVKQIGK